MLSINWSDVWKMVESIKVPLIVIGVALALAIIVSLAVFKVGEPAPQAHALDGLARGARRDRRRSRVDDVRRLQDGA